MGQPTKRRSKSVQINMRLPMRVAWALKLAAERAGVSYSEFGRRGIVAVLAESGLLEPDELAVLGRTVYALVDPRDDQVRYVGVSASPLRRLKGHLSMGEPGRRTDWIQELKDQGLKPVLRELEHTDDWAVAEQRWWQYFADEGCDLTNAKRPQADKGDSPTTQVNVRLPLELYERLQEEAEDRGVTRSDIIIEELADRYGLVVPKARRGRPRKDGQNVSSVPVKGAVPNPPSPESGDAQVEDLAPQVVDIAQALADRHGLPRAFFERKLRAGKVRLGSEIAELGTCEVRRLSELEVDL